MSGLSGNTGIMIAVISIAVVAVELIGYTVINLKLVCRKWGICDKIDENSLRKFATVVVCIVIAITNAFLMELL